MRKACNLKMTSFPINLSLSRFLFLSSTVLWLFILEVPHQKRRKGRITLAHLRRCECVRLCTHSVRFSHELISWYDSHGNYNKANTITGLLCFSAIHIHVKSWCVHVPCRWWCQRRSLKGPQHSQIRISGYLPNSAEVPSFNMNNISIWSCLNRSRHSGVTPLNYSLIGITGSQVISSRLKSCSKNWACEIQAVCARSLW